VRYVWRHLPLTDVHVSAQLAAEAVEAAHAQGRFWDMYDAVLAHDGAPTPPAIGRIAKELGLDVERMWAELRRREYGARVARDVASADASGVSGTPTFFVNGRRHQGAYDIDTLTVAVRFARRRAQLVPESAPPTARAGRARR
jgi:protein-disulfide isomerase